MTADPGMVRAVAGAVLVLLFGALVWIVHVLDVDRQNRRG